MRKLVVGAVVMVVAFAVPFTLAASSENEVKTPEKRLEEQVAEAPRDDRATFRTEAERTLGDYEAILRDGRSVDACREVLAQDPETLPCRTIVADYEDLQKLEAEGYDK